MGTPRKPPTVDIAIDECKKYGVLFSWQWGANSHVKFYITGYPHPILMSQGNKSNLTRIEGKIKSDIKKVMKEMGVIV